MATTTPGRTAGPLLKEWRLRRRRSQMDLALDVGVSPRHLSFVETGRSNPSPELLLVLAERLDVPSARTQRVLARSRVRAALFAHIARRSRDATSARRAPAHARWPRPLPRRGDRPAVERLVVQ